MWTRNGSDQRPLCVQPGDPHPSPRVRFFHLSLAALRASRGISSQDAMPMRGGGVGVMPKVIGGILLRNIGRHAPDCSMPRIHALVWVSVGTTELR